MELLDVAVKTFSKQLQQSLTVASCIILYSKRISSFLWGHFCKSYARYAHDGPLWKEHLVWDSRGNYRPQKYVDWAALHFSAFFSGWKQTDPPESSAPFPLNAIFLCVWILQLGTCHLERENVPWRNWPAFIYAHTICSKCMQITIPFR